jgi:hypothetical protein
MNDMTRQHLRALLTGALGSVLGLAGMAALAQGLNPPSTSAASDPNPYYVGVGQSFTHDSNVYRVPSGPGDTYSSTSLFGGFDQPISRQRVFGKASISANRYQDQTQLNNTSYDLATGLDWATIQDLSGNLNLALNQHLAAPAASSTVPVATRNVAQTENVNALARWGGQALLSLEGTLGYSKIDYSAPAYVASDSRQDSASLALHYRPGGPLRLGIAARVNRTKTPKALFDPASGNYQSNTLKGNNLDFLADYELTGLLTASGRLSYTKQTNSGINNADFSGLTGSLSLGWRPTGKISLKFDASHDAGFNTALYNANPSLQNGVTPVSTPVTGLYENNRVTNAVGLGLIYAATAKIDATAGVRYTRARLGTTAIAQSGSQTAPETTDVLQSAFIGANYAITRSWMLACNLAHEKRDVSGAVTYSYTANSVGCSAQFTWR